MAFLGAEESSNKVLQVELTTSCADASATQASSVTIANKQQQTSTSDTIASAFPATKIKLSNILRTDENDIRHQL